MNLVPTGSVLDVYHVGSLVSPLLWEQVEASWRERGRGLSTTCGRGHGMNKRKMAYYDGWENEEGYSSESSHGG